MIVADGVSEEMRRRTAEKFRQWDEAMAEGLFDRDDAGKRTVLNLLRDPTIYAYAFFKDKDGAQMRMYPYQDLILNDHHNRILFAAANQVGKSVSLCLKAVHFALTHPGTTTLMTSKTLPQSKDLLREIKRLLQSSKIDYKATVGDTDTKTEIYFRHFDEVLKGDKYVPVELEQSRIICVPATEAALGYPAHLILVDELAFYEGGEYFYYQIIQPRTYSTKGQIIVFSNPNGAQGVFWNLWGDDDFHSYRFNFLDCPRNTVVEYEKLRKKLTREQFDSTADAIFTSPRGGFFSLQERRAMQEDRPNELPVALTQPVYIAFDWGKAQDQTVRAIGVPVGEGDKVGINVYELKAYPQGTSYSEIVEDLFRLIDEVGYDRVAMVGWDNTGVGRGIEDFIKKVEEQGVAAVPVEFSLENKSRIYTSFKLLAERNVRGEYGIKLPFVAECDLQLSKLVFQRSGRGYLQVHHENESDRDDFCDSISCLCSLIVQPDSPPVTVTMVDDDVEASNPFGDDELGVIPWR